MKVSYSRFFLKKVFSRRILAIVLAALAGFLLLDGIYLYMLVPDWSVYARGPIPKSSFMQHYEQQRAKHRDWPALRWRPIAFSAMPKTLRRAVVVAEDSRFYDHHGVDWVALREAMARNLKQGRVVYGASTISQQTVKNLFLSPSRDPLRKWHELVLTLMMERRLSKSRILDIYLNIAEFGRDIYGVEAAAQYYFGRSAANLTTVEAVGLAASLPSPVKSNPGTRSRYFIRHRDTILARVAPAKPAPDDTGEASLPVIVLEAAPTPEEEEPQASASGIEQNVPDTAPQLPDNAASEAAVPLGSTEVGGSSGTPATVIAPTVTDTSDVILEPIKPKPIKPMDQGQPQTK